MIKGYIIAIVTLSIFCILAAFFLGRVSKTCDLCPEHTPVIKYIERKETIKKIEDEIKNIDTIITDVIINEDKRTRDSLRNLFNPR